MKLLVVMEIIVLVARLHWRWRHIVNLLWRELLLLVKELLLLLLIACLLLLLHTAPIYALWLLYLSATARRCGN
jgi:hypothetical protein